MKNLTLLLALLALSLYSNAHVLTVSNNNPSPGQYTDIVAAYNAANAGDTLYVSGSPTTYNALTVEKKIVIIGPGIRPTNKQDSSIATIASITLEPGSSDYSSFVGLNILVPNTGNYVMNLDQFAATSTFTGISIINCNIIGQLGYGFQTYAGWTINGCIWTDSEADNQGALIIGTMNNSIVSNNLLTFVFAGIFQGYWEYAGGYYDEENASFNESYFINNDVIATGNENNGYVTGLAPVFGGANVTNSYFQNNIFYNTDTSITNFDLTFAEYGGTNTGNSATNNVSTLPATYNAATSKNNIQNVSVLFENQSAGNYLLLPGSPAHNEGSDGTDAGIFGGTYVFDFYGEPSIPVITEIQPTAYSATSISANVTSFGNEITNAEYFWDNDPGIGKGTACTAFTAGIPVTFSQMVSTSGLTPGTHILYFRTQDVNSVWSLSEGTNVDRVSLSATICAGTSYTFNGKTLTETGSYADTIVNAKGFTSVVTLTLVVLPATATITASGPTAICEGSSVKLTANEGPYYEYKWSNGATTDPITVSAKGTYQVSITSTIGCPATTASIKITVNKLPKATIKTKGDTKTFCNGDDVKLTASGSGDDYHWSTGATAKDITISEQGTYSVTVTNDDHCSASAVEVIKVNCPNEPSDEDRTAAGGTDGSNSTNTTAGIISPSATLNSEFDVSVYPNPSSGEFHLKVTSSSYDNINVRVFDMLGRLFDEKTAITNGSDIVIGSNYVAGVYLVQVTQGSSIKQLRLVKVE